MANNLQTKSCMPFGVWELDDYIKQKGRSGSAVAGFGPHYPLIGCIAWRCAALCAARRGRAAKVARLVRTGEGTTEKAPDGVELFVTKLRMH